MKENRPDLTLNMDDKIYLAVAKNTGGRFAYVFTLACLKTANNSNSYNLNASREIHAFKNKESAEIFHDTVEQIIEVNLTNKNYQALFAANEKMIDGFINDNQR